MANSIISSDVTYKSLIEDAATYINTYLINHSTNIDKGSTFREDSYSGISGDITTIEKIDETYEIPASSDITADIKVFMKNVNIITVDTYDTTPTVSGLIAFAFALNYYVEKSLIKINKGMSGDSVKSPTYNLYYSKITSGYTNYLDIYTGNSTINENKITELYNTIKNINLLSNNGKSLPLSSSSSSSSCSSSSSSCSCSSSSSSWFIAFLKI